MTTEDKDARPKQILKILIVVLVLGALLLSTLATKIPLPLRLLLAAIDLVAAAFLWLALRQGSQKE
jgi:hypothetical protein